MIVSFIRLVGEKGMSWVSSVGMLEKHARGILYVGALRHYVHMDSTGEEVLNVVLACMR